MQQYYIGIDIGSTYVKAVVLDEKDRLIKQLLWPTGWNGVETANKLKDHLAPWIANGVIIATGYGRACVQYADGNMTEITCHGKGAAFLYGKQQLTVIDIGGQDTKIIQIDNGIVSDFLMNDKCSAGTGRFLEVMANILNLNPETMCKLAAQGKGVTISSMCTVFAESEVISLIGKGEKRENIAFAVVDSIVKKISSQTMRLLSKNAIVCLTGGLCECEYLKKSLSTILNRDIVTSPNGRYAGAIGAALLAKGINYDLSR